MVAKTNILGLEPAITLSGPEYFQVLQPNGLAGPSAYTDKKALISQLVATVNNFGLQTANTVYAGPSSGVPALPTFRSLVALDIPSLDASKITTGIFNPSRLGSGTPDATKFLRGDSTWIAVSLVAGVDQQVQFNDGGSAFGGDAGLTYNKTTDTLTVAGQVNVGNTSIATARINVGDATFSLDHTTSTTPTLLWDTGDSLSYDRTGNVLSWNIGAAARLQLTSSALSPSANDGLALGTGALSFSDAFFASGAVLSFNNGANTITHNPGTGYFDITLGLNITDVAPIIQMNETDAGAGKYFLVVDGGLFEIRQTSLANTGFVMTNTPSFRFNGAVTPNSNDGAPLGSAGLQWSDLFLASGGVINFANSDFNVTHSSGTLTFGSGANGVVSLPPGTIFRDQALSGEGGQFTMMKPQSGGTTISGDVNVDIQTNAFRIFETGGTNRGAFLDITAQAAGGGSTIFTTANLATQANANAGTSNTTLLTPLRATQGTLAGVRAGLNVHGGGTMTWDGSNVKWTTRLIVISDAKGTEAASNLAFWDINCPSSGSVDVVGTTAVTATASGIPMVAWAALYYDLTQGSGAGAAAFHIIRYDAGSTNFAPPPTWILLCAHNGDVNVMKFTNGMSVPVNVTKVWSNPIYGLTLSQTLDQVGSAANGDILYRTGGAWARLPIGSNTNVLTVSSSLPAWVAPAVTTIAPQVEVRTSGATVTIPTNATKLFIMLVGGGGGSGGAVGTPAGCCVPGTTGIGGGGGGGGGLMKYLSGLTPGNTLNLTIGAAGSAGGANGNGGAGGNSSLASGSQSITTLTANGGGAGLAGSNATGANGAGGGASNGDANFAGTSGSSTTAGGDPGIGLGNGGTLVLGGSANGIAAVGFGGGGSGAIANNATSKSGAAGTAGLAIIFWFP